MPGVRTATIRMNRTLNPVRRHRERCRETRALMSAYLDHELDTRSAARVKRHARWCPNCRRLLANLTRTVDGLRALGQLDDPLGAPGSDA